MTQAGRSLGIVYDVAYPFVEGGGERRLYEVARRLADDGWSVTWYCFQTWDGPSVQTLGGIKYVGLRGRSSLYRADGARSRLSALSFGRAVLFTQADFSAHDIVWCGQWPYFHVLALCARLVPWRTKLFLDWWEVWGSGWLSHGASGLGGWGLEIALANLVSRVGRTITISQLGYSQLTAIGARRKGVELIPNGVNVDPIVALAPAAGTSDLAFFGRLKNHKNVDHLVEAVALLKGRGLRLKADILGDGPERNKLESLAQQLDIADQIVFHGRVDDEQLFSILKRNRVFVHPSTKEGGGSITLLEANACGLPIVCYRHPQGIDPGMVQNKVTGMLVDDVSPSALADGITEMIRITEQCSPRNDCVAFAQRYDWREIAREYGKCFAKSLGQETRQPAPSLRPTSVAEDS